MTAESIEIIAKLQEKIHEVLHPLLPTSGGFALVDFPDHSNVGDSAIWLGELAYFHSQNIRPSYVCIHGDEGIPEGTIFIHGGGNFGDLWPKHQQFREMIVQRYPDRPVIQLPQSIHFKDKGNIAKTAAIMNRHPNFTLLVRDKQSYDIVKQAFTCRLELCPDMAFCLGVQRKAVDSGYPLLLLLRNDIEKSAAALTTSRLPSGAVVEDWLDEDPTIYNRIRRQAIRQLPLLGFKALNRNVRREVRYRLLAEDRLMRGLVQLASAKYIITDRLHVHILSILLNVPHIVLDNSYGKIRGFDETWTQGLTLAHTAENLDEAIAYHETLKAEDVDM